jgi:segregation and condensation protein B
LQKAEKQRLSSNVGSGQTSVEEKTRNDLALMEAALYVAGRPLDLNELCSVLKTRSKNKARKLAKMLMQKYEVNHVALEILELKDERYVLQLKADYTPLVKRLVNRPLLSAGPLKTLSYIAYRQPVSQKRVIDVRGHHAYGHVKMLKEMGLIAGERSGRSLLLRTTDYFADYFALSHDTATMKRELRNIFADSAKQDDAKELNG